MAVLMMLAAGCLAPELDDDGIGGSPPDDRAAQDARLTALLGARGFPAEQIVFAGDEVIVDGDTVMNRQALLAELDEAGAGDGLEAVSQAAYWFRRGGGMGPPAGSVPDARNVRLAFAANVPAVARVAVTRAATLWGLAAGPEGCVSMGEQGRGRVLTVRVQRLEGQDPATGETFPVAGRARLPMYVSGRWEVGDMMWIDPDTAHAVTAADRRWLEHVAVHEMGHILGFPHPQDSSAAQHIAGTRQRTLRAGYATVMDYDGEERELSADDVNGARRVYGPDRGGLCPGQR